jgi:cell division protein FtsQ
MEHSIAGRLGRRAPGARPGRRSVTPRLRRHLAALRLGRQLRVALPRRGRRWLLVALIGLPLLLGAWLWFRQSPFVSVQRVRISGLANVHGGDAPQIQAALAGAAHGMSTLDVNTAALRAAVASFPLVRSLQARASFPHELRIEVLEQPPVAQLTVAGTHTALAADGVVLGASLLSGSLPVVSVGGVRGASVPAVGRRVRQAQLREMLAVLGAAPAPVVPLVQHAYWGPQGLTFALRGGVLAYFGDATRPHAKWLSLVRVLADPSSAGASYVDVRLPERPAAGFPPGVTPPGATTHASEPTGASESATSSELDADLAAALGAGSSAGASSTAASGASSGASAAGEPSATEPAADSEAGAQAEPANAPAGAPSEASSGSAAEPGAAPSSGQPAESGSTSQPTG